MTELLISAAVSIVLAILGFTLGRLNLERATESERNEELRRRRIDTYASFCASVVEYRRAQLHRWFVGRDIGGSPGEVERQRPEVAQDIRGRRATAWSDFYGVLMICGDKGIEDLARRALSRTRRMKFAEDARQLEEMSNEVHAAVNDFARGAAGSVLARQQRPLAPAPTTSDLSPRHE